MQIIIKSIERYLVKHWPQYFFFWIKHNGIPNFFFLNYNFHYLNAKIYDAPQFFFLQSHHQIRQQVVQIWLVLRGQEVDDLTLRRFLRARDLDVEKGSAMFLKYLKWKRSFVPNGVSPSEIPEELAQGKLFSQGLDKKGRPIVVAFAAKHFQSKDGGDEFKSMIMETSIWSPFNGKKMLF